MTMGERDFLELFDRGRTFSEQEIENMLGGVNAFERIQTVVTTDNGPKISNDTITITWTLSAIFRVRHRFFEVDQGHYKNSGCEPVEIVTQPYEVVQMLRSEEGRMVWVPVAFNPERNPFKKVAEYEAIEETVENTAGYSLAELARRFNEGYVFVPMNSQHICDAMRQVLNYIDMQKESSR